MGSVESDDAHLAELMRAAQAGDRVAYEGLLLTIAPIVRRFIRRSRSFPVADDSEDVLQEVLLSVHAVRATYDPARPFLPWLLAIVRPRLADRGRRYARTTAHEQIVADLEVTFSGVQTNSFSEAYGDPEALHRAIEHLPAGQRQAIELLKLRELSLKEAAAASGSTVGALKVAVHRAMRALRRALSKP
jgi:RNA polymerase sigma factor (sigma-70 family)